MKFIYLFAFLFLILYGCSENYDCSCSKQNDEIIDISLVEVKEIYNDHVGNEWLFYIEYRGEIATIGEKISVNLDDFNKVKINCVLEEVDEKHEDYGKTVLSLRKSDLRRSGRLKKTAVKITERNGFYKGNTAKFIFSVCVCI